MGYLGGKKRHTYLFDFLNHPKFDGMDYIEPFLGFANVLYRIKNKNSYTASDCKDYLINFMNYIKINDIPDNFITKDHFNYLLKNKNSDDIEYCYARLCFTNLGLGQSYNDCRRNHNYKHFLSVKNSISFKESNIICCDYKNYLNEKNKLFYLDPPYGSKEGKKKYNNMEFNSMEFYKDVMELAKNNIVFLSEFEKNIDGFYPLYEFKRKSCIYGYKSFERTHMFLTPNKEIYEFFNKI